MTSKPVTAHIDIIFMIPSVSYITGLICRTWRLPWPNIRVAFYISVIYLFLEFNNNNDMTSMPSPPSLPMDTASKTAIIITELDKSSFVSDHGSFVGKMPLVDQIKLNILNLPIPPNVKYSGDEYFLNSIAHWSSLPFLHRIVIIMKNEESAKLIYEYLTSGVLPHEAKVSLQENLLSRSNSFDSLVGNDSLAITKDLSRFKEQHRTGGSELSQEYSEPEPQSFNVYKDLAKMGIDLNKYNDEDQILELKQDSEGPGLSRTKSLTKTLFKPDIKVNTQQANVQVPPSSDVLPSPTITLDETF